MNKGGLRVHPRKLKKKLDCKCNNQSYSAASFVNKGGLRVHPRNLKKKLDCKCCNQRYSGALFVFFFYLYFFSIPEQLRFFWSSSQLCQGHRCV